ncbi:MAG: peptidylprolyl isomerase [Candidatus Lokiarchaeota archaeon]|nr:peptidylprolyl isomerase [Candidatus Lokiarchaeota archaeon]MBD3198894.1 peptidylprolyl isomerase [Candidatus Lokiarchaeota archaeon]
MTIKEGDVIKVEYLGTLDDGSIFDSTEKSGTPLKFEVGSKSVISGFDKSVLGKEVGDEYSIRLNPEEAYGDYNEKLIQKVPIDQFPDKEKIKEGMMIVLMDPNNNQFPATIKEIGEEFVLLDLNHPMAGKTLNFKIKILETGCEIDSETCAGCGSDCGHNH